MPSKKKNLKNNEEKVVTAAMRHPALYILSIIVLVVIVGTFIFGSTLSKMMVSNNQYPVFGIFKGQKIMNAPNTVFNRALTNNLQNAQDSNGSLNFQAQYTATKQAYDSTVLYMGMLDLADQAGIVISDQEVTQILARSNDFKDVNGRFSRTKLNQALSENPGLKDSLRKDLTASSVYTDYFNRAALSDNEKNFISSMGSDRRIFDIVSFEFKDFPDSEAISYLNDNATLFQRADFSSITMDSVKALQDVRNKIDNGEATFEELATSLSTDLYASEKGSRGEVYYYDLQRDLDNGDDIDKVFSLSQGDISPIIKLHGSDKYAIFRLDSNVIQPDSSSQDVVEQVKGYILALERGLVSDYFTKKADDLEARISDIGWASALTEAGMTATTTDSIPINYGDIPLFPTMEATSNSILAGVSSREDIIKEMFSLAPGTVTDPLALKDRVVIIRYVEPGGPTDGQASIMQAYIPYLSQQYLNQEMLRQFSDPKNLKDTFTDGFRTMLAQSQAQ